MHRRTKEYAALEAEWDKKLADSGFQDIEQRKDGNLKFWSTIFVNRHTFSRLDAKQAYYRAAGHFLHDHKFTSYERKVWELHAEGISMRNIVKILQDRDNIRTYRRRVHETIQSLVREMVKYIRKENDRGD